MKANYFNLSMQETEVCGSQVLGQPGLEPEFQDIQGYKEEKKVPSILSFSGGSHFTWLPSMPGSTQ